MTIAEAPPPRIRIAWVIQATFSVIQRNVVLFGLLSLLINTPLISLQMVTAQLAIRDVDITLSL
jgi:hypothetical protein